MKIQLLKEVIKLERDNDLINLKEKIGKIRDIDLYLSKKSKNEKLLNFIFTSTEDSLIKRNIIKNLKVSDIEIFKIKLNENYLIAEILDNPNVKEELLLNLLKTRESFLVRVKIGSHPNLSKETILELSKLKENLPLKKGLAININTPIEVLKLLSKEEDLEILKNVARNQNTPIDIINNLYKKNNIILDYSLCYNPSLHQENKDVLYKILSRYYNKNNELNLINFSLANNEYTNSSILTKLAKDNNNIKIKKLVAKNKNTPIEVLKELSKKKFNEEIFGELASNSNTPIEILEEFASNSSTNIKLNLIKNPNISSSILQKFYEDENENEEVRFQAYIHDNFKKY